VKARTVCQLIGLLAAARAWAEGPRPTVAVDFAALDEAAYRRLDALTLEQRVVLRLAQEGFAVVAPKGDPEILIRLRVLADRVVTEDAAAPAPRIELFRSFWTEDKFRKRRWSENFLSTL